MFTVYFPSSTHKNSSISTVYSLSSTYDNSYNFNKFINIWFKPSYEFYLFLNNEFDFVNCHLALDEFNKER